MRAGRGSVSLQNKRADLIRSLLEGVSYSQKDGLEIIRKWACPVNSVRVSGGGAKCVLASDAADVFNLRVAVLESEEGSAYGAALLALVGTADSRQ